MKLPLQKVPWWVWLVLGILVYLFAMFATYGYARQRRDCEGMEASFAGIVWPVYWGGRLVIGCAAVAEDMFAPRPPVKVER